MVGRHEVAESGEIDWGATVRKCGLEVSDYPIPPDALDPQVAVLSVAGGNTRPAVTVARNEDSLVALDAHWQEISTSLTLSHGGEFLIILWGPGSIERGWFRVRESEKLEAGLPSRVYSAVGRPEFCCLSIDSKLLYAVTVEQGEYWIVTREFGR